ncbi:MAG TPA: hypothetical protein VMB72_00895, partial [Acidimicrobiales bacterium]|nr:hypothetical protein [Acidimicrobiales bacterium]
MDGALHADWGLRPVSAALAERYVAEGWWGDATVGGILAGAIDARPELTFRIRSAVRPWQGTVG